MYTLEDLIRWADQNARSVAGDDSAIFVSADEQAWKQVADGLRKLAALPPQPGNATTA